MRPSVLAVDDLLPDEIRDVRAWSVAHLNTVRLLNTTVPSSDGTRPMRLRKVRLGRVGVSRMNLPSLVLLSLVLPTLALPSLVLLGYMTPGLIVTRLRQPRLRTVVKLLLRSRCLSIARLATLLRLMQQMRRQPAHHMRLFLAHVFLGFCIFLELFSKQLSSMVDDAILLESGGFLAGTSTFGTVAAGCGIHFPYTSAGAYL